MSKQSCDITPRVINSEGQEVKSKLFEDLQKILPKRDSRNFYDMIKSEQFKTLTNYSELELDENGEPTIQTLLEHTNLNKRMNDSSISESIIREIGIRSVDSIKSEEVVNALVKITEMNEKLSAETTGKQFFRVALLRTYNPYSKKISLEVKVYRYNNKSDFWQYQMNAFLDNISDIVQQIPSARTINDLIFKSVNTLPMGIDEIDSFNPYIINFLIKEVKSNIGKTPTPINTVSIENDNPLYSRAKKKFNEISDDELVKFIEKEKLPINTKEFKDNPTKHKEQLFNILFSKYQINSDILNDFNNFQDLGYLKELFERLNKETIKDWNKIEIPSESKKYTIEDTLISRPEDDPIFIDTEKLIDELGDKYDIEQAVIAGAKDLLIRIINAEKNQLHIQNRLETNGMNTEARDKKALVSILINMYEEGQYDTALFQYYNNILERIKNWKELINSKQADSIEMAKNLRQAHLELVMFNEISDFLRKNESKISLNKEQIKEDILQAVGEYMNFQYYDEVESFLDTYNKDKNKFESEYPELGAFARAYFAINDFNEENGLNDLNELILPKIKNLEDDLYAKEKALVSNFLKEYQDSNAEIIPWGKDKGKKMDIDELLSKAQRDMNGFERLLDAFGDSPDMILRLLDKAAKQAKNEARLDSIDLAKEISAEAKLLENAGIKDTSWMFHRNEKGEKTGRYIMNGDPEMAEINANPAKLRFYNFFMNCKQYVESFYPPNSVRTEKIISINKDLLERVKEADGIKGMVDEYLESVKDEWMNRNQEAEDNILGFTQGGYTLNGEEINVLPIFYQNVQFGDQKALNDISEDAVSTLIAYSAKAIDYQHSNKIINKMELARLVLKQREIPIKRNGVTVHSAITSKLQKEQEECDTTIYYKDDGKSNLSKRIGGFMDVMFYAKSRRDDIAIGKFSAIKIVDKLNAWTAKAAMSLSLLNGLSNVATGNMMMTYEALAKHYFKPSDVLWADITYAKNSVAMLGNLGNRIKDDKLSLFTEMFDVSQEYDKDMFRDVKWNRKTKMGRIEFGKALMFMQDSGEHWMSHRTALSVAHTTMLKDKEGNLHNLWDSLEIEYLQDDMSYGTENKGLGARLKIKDGYTKEDGTEFTNNDIVKIQTKIASINQGMHGIYNKMDSNMIQMTAIGRLAYLFRKWIWKSYSKRFEGMNYNYNIGEWNEGYYRSCWHFISGLAKDVKNAKLDIALHWNELHPTEKANCKKVFYEVGILLSLMAFNAMVDWGDGDDDDNWAKNMFKYQAIRLQSELSALTPISAINEAVRLGKSPIPALNTVTNMLDTLKAGWIPNWFEEVDRGWAKGHSKGFKYLMNNKVINPYFLTLEKTANVAEQTKWYMQ